MANVNLTIGMITREAGRILTNSLKLAGFVNTDYDDQFAQTGAKIGSIVNARMPVKYLLRRGQALQPQASVETSVPIAIQFQTGVDLQFSSAALVLDIDDYSKCYIAAAMATVVNDVDYQVGQPTRTHNARRTGDSNTNRTYMQAGAFSTKPRRRVTASVTWSWARYDAASSTPTRRCSTHRKSRRSTHRDVRLNTLGWLRS